MKILNLSDAQDQKSYRFILSVINGKNPYYRVEFFEAFSLGLENLICFCQDINGEYILLPGYIRNIEGHEDLKDFTSPYGYSGPLYSDNIDQNDLHLFWQEVQTWMQTNNIISSFIRFSLNNNYCGFPGEIRITLSNIKGKILPAEDQWNHFDRKVRKNVNIAKREGLAVKIFWGYELSEELFEKFYLIYIHTLKRTNADQFYYFTNKGIWNFVRENSSLCAFAFAYDKSEIISTEMILISEDTIFSFLGGTKIETFSKRPNDLLKYEIICWARCNKYAYYVLGGGYGKDDGIFRFKRAFFPNDIVNFMTGWYIIDNKIYSLLVKECLSKLSRSESQLRQFKSIDYFPAYRKPVGLL